MEDSPTQNIDENQLFKEDETDLSTADAVSLFNASLSAALEQQKTEILSEFQKTLPVTSPVNADISVNAQSSGKLSTVACQPGAFDFKQEGTKSSSILTLSVLPLSKRLNFCLNHPKPVTLEQLLRPR